MAQPDTGRGGRLRRFFLGWGGGVLVALLVIVAGVGTLVLLWHTERLEPPEALRDMVGIRPEALTLVLVKPRGLADDQFQEGVTLALQRVNADGGIAGLPVVLKVVLEEAYTEAAQLEDVVANSLDLANDVASEPHLLAVIGHWASATALPASSIYNSRDVLYLASHATASSLTNHGFDYVFALQPNNADSASIMAHYAIKQGLQRFVVLSDDTDFGGEITSLFGSWATQGGGELLYRGSLTSYGRSVDRLLLFLLDNNVFAKEDIDAFYVASSSVSDTAEFIRRARELGLTVPILGPDYLFSRVVEGDVGIAKMKDVVSVSLYDENSEEPAARTFVQSFQRAYGKLPDQMAAIGYDAVMLLAFAAKKTGSRNPAKIADWLRIMRHDEKFVGATGVLVFDAKGLVTDTDAFIVRHDGTHFHTVASYRKPLEWNAIGLPAHHSYH